MSFGIEESATSYKSNKNNSGKVKSHLVSERFLLTVIKVLSSNISLSRREITNIRKFLSIIDRKYYSVDITTEALLLVCDMLVSIRLSSSNTIDVDKLILKVDMLLTDQYEDPKNHLIIPTIKLSKLELPEEDLDFISCTIDYNLKYSKVITSKDVLVDLANEISNCSYTDFPEVFKSFRETIVDIYNHFRSTDVNTKVDQIAHTSDPSFLDYLFDTYQHIKNPASSLRTGMKDLNSSLGPREGFLNKNLYLFYANTNSFKSAFLLHLARMIRTYNSDRLSKVYKETGKIPTVLFLEYENDLDEDNERLYKMETSSDMLYCKSKEELLNPWKEKYQNPDNPVDISFLHASSRTMTVQDIDNMIESLNEEGYKVICTIVDYLEGICPNKEDTSRDVRFQYKNIAEDLLSLAKTRDIPVITAHQLNRAGGAILTTAKTQGTVNAVNSLTNEYIGESYAIEKTASYSAFIDIEEYNGVKYFMYKRNKARYRRYGVETFVYPIKDGIIFEDDIDLLERLSMDSIPNTNNPNISSNPNEGKRGKYDLRDPKKLTTQIDHQFKIVKTEPDATIGEHIKGFSLIDMLGFNNWYDYIDEYGLEAITDNVGEVGICNNDNCCETIEDVEYVWM